MLEVDRLEAIFSLFRDPKKGGTKGLCYGLTCKYLDALFCNDRKNLYLRLALIEKYQDKQDELVESIQLLYDKLKDTDLKAPLLTDEDMLMIEIRPFFENIILQLHPNYYPEIYNRLVMQSYVANHKFSAPQALEHSNPQLMQRSFHAKTEVELVSYFEQLKSIVRSSKQQIGFIVESDEHSIGLNYNSDSDKWELLNSKTLIQSELTGNYHLELSSYELATTLKEALQPLLEEEEKKEPKLYVVFSISCIALEMEPSIKSELQLLNPLVFDKPTLSRVNEDNVSTFFLAVQAGDMEAVEAMLPNVADIDAARYDGETALSMAAQEGHLEVMKLLIKKGADVDFINDMGETLLHIAAAMGHTEIVAYLLTLELEINEEDNDLQSPLIKAISGNHYKTVQFLIAHGAIVNVQDIEEDEEGYGENEGIEVDDLVSDINKLDLDGVKEKEETLTRMPPLFFAVKRGNPEIIKALLEAGADINYKDKDGATVLDVAQFSDAKETLSILEASMAKEADSGVYSCTTELFKKKHLALVEHSERVHIHQESSNSGEDVRAFFDKVPSSNSEINNKKNSVHSQFSTIIQVPL